MDIMKCVITGMPEKMSTEDKESRRGMDMKCFITGHTGERVDERKKCDDEVRTFMKFKMLHNGICRRMNLLLITSYYHC